ncbi:MAG: MmgE/PrpD family protein, partial [Proteobacteria bacterium]|nr:MmgE/PrpD family protein [Pseudomonadota bacterium]
AGAITQGLAGWSSAFRSANATASADRWARHALMDWFAVTIAGAREPLADILCEEFKSSTSGPCTVIARNAKASLHDAALVNGAVSHALDYDDVNRLMHGHPTVPVAASVLALGEAQGSSGRDVLTAFIAGYEVECRLGDMAGDGHYEQGFHATGTFGTFGAAAAAANLLKLDAERTAMALGIAASEAAGLKINFGTMTKPLHAGKAAMNGLMAARIAARGFTARPDAIEAPQGFFQTQAPGYKPAPMRPDAKAPLAVEQNLFKYHAACYLTHSPIEAIRDLKRQHNIGPDDVKLMTVHVDPGHLKVCCIPEPKSGLEIKFALRHLAGMALAGADTAALGTYSDENALDPRYIKIRERVTLDPKPRPAPERHGADVSIELVDGRKIKSSVNVGIPASDVSAQEAKLEAKFNSLVEPVLGRQKARTALDMIKRFEELPSLKALMETVG